MKNEKEKAASAKTAQCQKGNAKSQKKNSRKDGEIQSVLFLGEGEEFPLFLKVFVLPQENFKGGKNDS